MGLLLFCSFYLICGNAQKKGNDQTSSNMIEVLLSSHPEYFKNILAYPDSFGVQIVYTQINRDKNNRPSFKEFTYGKQKNSYFYPASTVKMPIAFLALEKLNELNLKGLDKNTTMVTDSSFDGEDVVYTHPQSADSRATIAHYIKQIFLVSDNDAFNRLYEFLGQEYIQKKLTQKGYPDAEIRHRLNISKTVEQNRHTNPVSFYDTLSHLLWQQPGMFSKAVFPKKDIRMGKGYYSKGQLVNEPFDFSDKNRISLQDQQHILQSVLFPAVTPQKNKFNLTKEDYSFVKQWMSAYPKESSYPYYDSTNYWDAYCKFLLYGSERGSLPAHIRIFNKVGDAYGFLIDITYIVDFENHIEFLLSAVIACNSDGIYNDDHYDYETVGFPFMKNLGQTIYEYELKRPRKYKPDLRAFQLNY